LAQSIPERVDAIFSAYDRPDSPGCALGVIQDGKLIYDRGYGQANLDYRLPLTRHSVFDIGSTSKQFVALVALLIEQEGKWKLDDPVRKYLPELPDYGSPLTLRHMLTHTSGLRDYLTLFSLAQRGRDDFYTDEDVVAMIVRQKELNFPPGSDYLYSNSGYYLISTLVKRVTGRTLRQYAQDKIFAPLGMSHTHFHDRHQDVVRERATGYAPREAAFELDMSTLDMVGDGGVYTTVDDLLKWDTNFYEGKVGGMALLSQMQTPAKFTSGPSAGQAFGYGLGLRLNPYRAVKAVSHGGAWAGYRAELLRFPDQRFSVICLCNLATTDPTALARRVADIYLASHFREPVPAPPPPPQPKLPPPVSIADMQRYEGSYDSEELGVTYQIKADKQGIRFVHRNPGQAVLVPVGGGRFLNRGRELQFEEREGRIVGFRLQAGRVKNLRFVRK
jgi:CubicO group peptidase (beta-lactamase class C family)